MAGPSSGKEGTSVANASAGYVETGVAGVTGNSVARKFCRATEFPRKICRGDNFS